MHASAQTHTACTKLWHFARLITGVLRAPTGEVYASRKQPWQEMARDEAAKLCLKGPAGDDASLPVVYLQPTAKVILDDDDGAYGREGACLQGCWWWFDSTVVGSYGAS
jgi:hypothetical protein